MAEDVAVHPQPREIVNWGGSNDVARLSAAQFAARQRWAHLTDLLGGTQHMRTCTRLKEWLPPLKGESPEAYRWRQRRAFLYPAFRDTVAKLSARPFSHRPVVLVNGEALNPSLQRMEANVDKAGRNLTQFCRAWLRDGLIRGMSLALIDFPATNGVYHHGDEMDRGIWPTWVHITGDQILGVHSDIASETGQVYLTQLRYEAENVEPYGPFGERTVKRIRIWNAPEMDGYGQPLVVGGLRAQGTMETWVEVDRQWKLESGPIPHSYPGIPVVPFFTAQTGFFEGEPYFEDLGWLNIRHWQSLSDQNNILDHARVPMRYEFGVDTSIEDIEATAPTKTAASSVIRAVNPDAKAGFVEIRGDAIPAGERDLNRLEERMQQLGSAPLVERVATATEASIKSGETLTVMQSWIRDLETACRDCYLVAARWLEWGEAKMQGRLPKPDRQLLPEKFAIDIFSDFQVARGDASQAELLLKARLSQNITQRRFLEELQARGMLADTMDIDAELAELAMEGQFSVPPAGQSDETGDDSDVGTGE